MMSLLTIAAFLVAPGIAPAAAVDADLRARFEVAAVSGVEMVQLAGESRPAAHICAGPAAKCAGRNDRYDINWGSAPDKVVPILVPAALAKGARVLLASDKGDPLLLAKKGRLLVAMTDPTGALRRWPYFNYVLYSAASEVAGLQPAAFADWENGPLPQARTRRTVFVVAVVLWALALVLYRIARNRGRRRPQAAIEFFRAADAMDAQTKGKKAHAGWRRTGFTRPLAGLLTLLSVMAVVTGIFLTVQWILSGKVQPFPEADGMWNAVYDGLWIVYMFFDMGTQSAAVKYFAQCRVSDPGEALAHMQFYVWWQVFRQLVQGTLIAGVALGVLPLPFVGYVPHSAYAIYVPFLIIYSFAFLPGIHRLGMFLTQGLQRTDVPNLLDLAELRVMLFIVPIPFVLLARSWGLAHPMYGEAFGAALGLGIGIFFTNMLVLAIGLTILRRMGLPLAPLFYAQFNRKIAKKQLVLGFFVTLGQEPIKLTQALETIIIVKFLADFTAWTGIRGLLSTRLNMLNFFAWMFFMSGIPAFSEAYAAGKKKLMQYYVARYFQFGFLFVCLVFSLLVAVGPAFIASMGSQWSRALPYVAIYFAGGLLLPTAWLNDTLQQGTGKGATFFGVILIEQVTRIALFIVLVPRYQFLGLILSMNGGLMVKAVAAWIINHKTIVPLRLSLWSTLVGPGVACAVNFALWRGVIALWAPTSTVAVLALVCVACTLSLFICFFVCALAGGYDRVALDELAEAAEMTNRLLRPLARAFARAALLGAKLAPFTPAPLDLIPAARAEAAELDALAAAAIEKPIMPPGIGACAPPIAGDLADAATVSAF